MIKMNAEHWIGLVSKLKIEHDELLSSNNDKKFKDVERKIVDMGSDLIGDICFDQPPKFDRINNVMALAKPEQLPEFLQILLIQFGGKHRDKIPAFDPFLAQVKMYMDEKGETPSSNLLRIVEKHLEFNRDVSKVVKEPSFDI